MAEFVIKMADERGRVLEQVERGYSPAEVQERFAQQGYLVYSVKPQGLLTGGHLSLGKRRVKLEQFVIFNQQFLTLLKAGLPRSEEHTSELQSRGLISYAVFCLDRKSVV